MSKYKFTRDPNGVLGQIQPGGWVEGGDSAAWQGHYVYLTGDNTPNYVDFFETGLGAYVRHPKPEQTNNGFGAYYKNPWNGCISRDQLTGVLCAVIRLKDYKAMVRIILNHSLRGFLFTYNTIKNGTNPETARWKLPDLTIFDIWATMLRGLGPISYILWPVLCVLDLHTLINSIIHNFKDENDVISFTGKYLVSLEFVPTPVSWLSSKVLNHEKLLKDLDSYWSGWRENSGMVYLYEKKFKELGLIK